MKGASSSRSSMQSSFENSDASGYLSSITFDDSFTTFASNSARSNSSICPTVEEDEELQIAEAVAVMAPYNASNPRKSLTSSSGGTGPRRRVRRYSMPSLASSLQPVKDGRLLASSNHRFEPGAGTGKNMMMNRHSAMASTTHALCGPPRRRPSDNSDNSGTLGASTRSDATSIFSSFNDSSVDTIETGLLEGEVSSPPLTQSNSRGESLKKGSQDPTGTLEREKPAILQDVGSPINKYGARRASMDNDIGHPAGSIMMYTGRLSPTLESEEVAAEEVCSRGSRGKGTVPKTRSTIVPDHDSVSTLSMSLPRENVVPAVPSPPVDDDPALTPGISNTYRKARTQPAPVGSKYPDNRRQSLTLEAALAFNPSWAVRSSLTLDSVLMDDSGLLTGELRADSPMIHSRKSHIYHQNQLDVESSLTMSSILKDYSSPNIFSKGFVVKGSPSAEPETEELNGLRFSSHTPSSSKPPTPHLSSLAPCNKPERCESASTTADGSQAAQGRAESSLTTSSTFEDYSSPNPSLMRCASNHGKSFLVKDSPLSMSDRRELNILQFSPGAPSSSKRPTAGTGSAVPAAGQLSPHLSSLMPCNKPERCEPASTTAEDNQTEQAAATSTVDIPPPPPPSHVSPWTSSPTHQSNSQATKSPSMPRQRKSAVGAPIYGLTSPRMPHTTTTANSVKPPLVQPVSTRTLSTQESQETAPSMPTRRESLEGSCCSGSVTSTYL